jgi:hypothetical protein
MDRYVLDADAIVRIRVDLRLDAAPVEGFVPIRHELSEIAPLDAIPPGLVREIVGEPCTRQA